MLWITALVLWKHVIYVLCKLMYAIFYKHSLCEI